MPDTTTERRAVEKLIPFLVNGSLDPEERTQVESAVEEDAGLQGEVVFLEELREGVRHSTEVPELGDLGLARLKQSMRKQRRQQWLRPALAWAAGLALIVQAALLFQGSEWNQERGARLAGAAHADLQVQFAPDATQGDLQVWLRNVGARIVDGPSAAGLYRLELEPRPASEEAWAALLQEFESRDDLVEFVERE